MKNKTFENCVSEILEIAKKYDMGIIGSLHDKKGLSGSVLDITSPSWSLFKDTDSGLVYKGEEDAMDFEVDATVNMIMGGIDICEHFTEFLTPVGERFKKTYELERISKLKKRD